MRLARLRDGPVPALGVVLLAGIAGALHGRFTDLSVYQHAARTVLGGASVYASVDPATGLRFTYPPFAAIVLAPLAPLPAPLAGAIWTAASVAALMAVVRLVRQRLERPVPGWLIAVLTVGSLALEPVWQNLDFGQSNLLLMLLILADVLGRRSRWSGVGIGLAAGIKLTPLVLVVFLLLIGRRWAAGRAAAVFLLTVAVGFLLAPSSSQRFWASDLATAGRVGPPELAHNQSIFGALTRLFDGPPPTLLWLAIAGPIGVGAVALGAVLWRRGEPVLGTGLAAVAMLLASPISWSHHWVWCIPVALALWERRQRRRWAGALWTAVFVTRPILWPPYGQDREFDWSPAEHVAGNAYLLASLALCGAAAAHLGVARGRTRERPAARPMENRP